MVDICERWRSSWLARAAGTKGSGAAHDMQKLESYPQFLWVRDPELLSQELQNRMV